MHAHTLTHTHTHITAHTQKINSPKTHTHTHTYTQDLMKFIHVAEDFAHHREKDAGMKCVPSKLPCMQHIHYILTLPESEMSSQYGESNS